MRFSTTSQPLRTTKERFTENASWKWYATVGEMMMHLQWNASVRQTCWRCDACLKSLISICHFGVLGSFCNMLFPIYTYDPSARPQIAMFYYGKSLGAQLRRGSAAAWRHEVLEILTTRLMAARTPIAKAIWEYSL